MTQRKRFIEVVQLKKLAQPLAHNIKGPYQLSALKKAVLR